MKKLFIILISVITISACTKSHDKINTRNGYTYDLDTLQGHSIVYDNRTIGATSNHGLIHDPNCEQCKVELKKLITEVMDSIIDEKVITLLGKN